MCDVSFDSAFAIFVRVRSGQGSLRLRYSSLRESVMLRLLRVAAWVRSRAVRRYVNRCCCVCCCCCDNRYVDRCCVAVWVRSCATADAAAGVSYSLSSSTGFGAFDCGTCDGFGAVAGSGTVRVADWVRSCAVAAAAAVAVIVVLCVGVDCCYCAGRVAFVFVIFVRNQLESDFPEYCPIVP